MSIKKFVETGEYFEQARAWYNEIFLLPLIIRSYVFILLVVIFFCFGILTLNAYLLLPLDKQVMYIINVEDTSEFNSKIIHADYYDNDNHRSIAKIFVEKYITIRETYDYEALPKYLLFVQNNSTKAIYNRYNYGFSLDNPRSLVLKYQEDVRRTAQIKSLNFIDDNSAVAVCNAKAVSPKGQTVEDMDWEITLNFIMDGIDPNIKENTQFNFTVTEYKVKLIKDYNA